MSLSFKEIRFILGK